MSTNRSRAHATRKRKNRVVNLRKSAGSEISDTASFTTEFSETNSAPSINVIEPPQTPVMEEREIDLETPPRSSTHKVRFQQRHERSPMAADVHDRSRPSTPKDSVRKEVVDNDETPRPPRFDERRRLSRPKPPVHHQSQYPVYPAEKRPVLPRSMSATQLNSDEGFTGGILEQAWMMKVQAENRRRVQWEKASRSSVSSAGFWEKAEGDDVPPPAYVV